MLEKICTLTDLTPLVGVPALVQGEQVAIFRLKDGNVYAVSNYDPFSQANVIARGITGNLKGFDVVASPIYKQHFDLKTGLCLEDETVSLKTYQVTVDGDNVLIAHH
ncbi:nitrite reductase small subunit NirD [Aquirhabdus sp.]|uniref:nitrite reductase small subunit NirD n=1 Tax=Aquirhabdus sp. TaxID=2824160 RepID=UPI00396CE814